MHLLEKIRQHKKSTKVKNVCTVVMHYLPKKIWTVVCFHISTQFDTTSEQHLMKAFSGFILVSLLTRPIPILFSQIHMLWGQQKMIVCAGTNLVSIAPTSLLFSHGWTSWQPNVMSYTRSILGRVLSSVMLDLAKSTHDQDLIPHLFFLARFTWYHGSNSWSFFARSSQVGVWPNLTLCLFFLARFTQYQGNSRWLVMPDPAKSVYHQVPLERKCGWTAVWWPTMDVVSSLGPVWDLLKSGTCRSGWVQMLVCKTV